MRLILFLFEQMSTSSSSIQYYIDDLMAKQGTDDGFNVVVFIYICLSTSVYMSVSIAHSIRLFLLFFTFIYFITYTPSTPKTNSIQAVTAVAAIKWHRAHQRHAVHTYVGHRFFSSIFTLFRWCFIFISYTTRRRQFFLEPRLCNGVKRGNAIECNFFSLPFFTTMLFHRNAMRFVVKLLPDCSHAVAAAAACAAVTFAVVHHWLESHKEAFFFNVKSRKCVHHQFKPYCCCCCWILSFVFFSCW